MPAPKKIPPALEPDIIAKAGQGATAQQIADWLASDHGVKVTSRAVAHHLKKTQAQRTEITKAVAREKLAPLVTSDLDELEAVRQRAHVIEQVVRTPADKLKAMELQRKVIDTKLHYAGADEPNAAEPTVARVVILPALKEPTE